MTALQVLYAVGAVVAVLAVCAQVAVLYAGAKLFSTGAPAPRPKWGAFFFNEVLWLVMFLSMLLGSVGGVLHG